MTPEELAAIRARVEAATEGPWEHSLVGIDPIDDEYVVQTEAVADVICRLDRSSEFIEHPMASARADAEFIAHARTDLPAALDEITRLRAALDEAAAERDRAQRAAKTLGGIVEQNARMILDITGLHDWIDEDGDGDWGAVWESAYALLPRAEAAESALAAIRTLARSWSGRHDLLMTGDGAAHDIEAALAANATTDEGDPS